VLAATAGGEQLRRRRLGLLDDAEARERARPEESPEEPGPTVVGFEAPQEKEWSSMYFSISLAVDSPSTSLPVIFRYESNAMANVLPFEK
jgi:hypothetical protein